MRRNWFDDVEENLIKATELFYGAVDQFLLEDEIPEEFHKDIDRELFAKQIFESNRIEGEGLSEGETKKMVLAEFGESFSLLKANLKDISLNAVKIDKKNNEAEFSKLGITVKYKQSELEIYAVIGHLTALLFSDIRAATARLHKNEVYEKFLESVKPNSGESVVELDTYSSIRFVYASSTKKERYISEALLKKAHQRICFNSDNNHNGEPGEYRPHPANIDDDTVFLEPALINGAMKKLVSSHYARLDANTYNPIIEATRLKEEFIKIHPFGDFNGRLSRIILSGFLRSEGYPYYVILRGSSKEKRRYISCMKYAFRGNPLPLVSLISTSLIEQIEVINARLDIAGIKPITPMSLSQKEKIELIDSLNQYRSECKNFRI
jgi:fido (protein-threonine AMPylation protein)